MFELQTLFLFLFGLVVGGFGTMLGVGGGWVHVPFFMLLYKFSPQDAIGTSIGIIFFNTLAGSIIYFYQKQMDLGLAKKLVMAIIPGALIGPFIVQKYTSEFFLCIFSFLLIAIAIYLFFKGSGIAVLPSIKYDRVITLRDASNHEVTYATNVELGVIGTFFIGFLSNLFGIGGGIIHVPYMIMFLRVPTHIALGTSHLLLCISSGIGMLIYLIMGNTRINFMMPIAMGAILGARVGAGVARETDAALIRKAIACVLFFVAIRIFVAAI